MNIVKFKLPDGSTDCYVNLDAVVAAKPTEEGKIILHTSNLSLTVDREQFEKTISEKNESRSELGGVISRLITAMDRMTVHFPTSIRMHY